jgi:hypothetical protein
MIRLILKDEDTKKKLLRNGINLDQMHYKCVQALEDLKNFPKVLQCYNCQHIGDHMSGACKEEQKCVLCSEPHRKSECMATKDKYKCANCSGFHAAWSQECPRLREAIDMKKKPTLAQVASATVTPALLQQVLQEVKESIVMIIAEVVSRSICELVLEITGKNVSKLALPLKVASISSYAVNAANKLKFGTASNPVENLLVKDRVMEKCFPKNSPAETPSQNPKGSGSKVQ